MGMDRIADRAIIDGKRFAAGLLDDITARVKKLEEETGQVPGLAVVLVGEDPASRVYVGSKHRQTLAAGIASFKYELPAETTQEELM
ncbi:tetrahydrofolate dehydrogenase/cyclohydrolase catalytic domain-containing protein, partial [Sinorhizobium medicae]